MKLNNHQPSTIIIIIECVFDSFCLSTAIFCPGSGWRLIIYFIFYFNLVYSLISTSGFWTFLLRNAHASTSKCEACGHCESKGKHLENEELDSSYLYPVSVLLRCNGTHCPFIGCWFWSVIVCCVWCLLNTLFSISISFVKYIQNWQ